MGEDLECLCQIMRTVGPRLDHEKAKVRAPSSDYCAWSCRGARRWDGAVAAERNALSSLSSALYLDANCCIVRSPHFCPSLPQSLMDQYFGRMRSLMNNKELPARIRFLLQDTVELRENNWVPRKAFIDNGPKTINQIRQDAVKVSFVCPAQQKLGSHTTAAVWPLRVFFSAGFGCFHPSAHVSGDEERLLPGKPLHAPQSETWPGDARWFGGHVWTDARCVKGCGTGAGLAEKVYILLFT